MPNGYLPCLFCILGGRVTSIIRRKNRPKTYNAFLKPPKNYVKKHFYMEQPTRLILVPQVYNIIVDLSSITVFFYNISSKNVALPNSVVIYPRHKDLWFPRKKATIIQVLKKRIIPCTATNRLLALQANPALLQFRKCDR